MLVTGSTNTVPLNGVYATRIRMADGKLAFFATESAGSPGAQHHVHAVISWYAFHVLQIQHYRSYTPSSSSSSSAASSASSWWSSTSCDFVCFLPFHIILHRNRINANHCVLGMLATNGSSESSQMTAFIFFLALYVRRTCESCLYGCLRSVLYDYMQLMHLWV